MRIYESEDYLFDIVGNNTVNGRKLTFIEFKPNDSDSEYSKLRLAVDEKRKRMTSMEVFSKDGSKYTMSINSMKTNIKYEGKIFVFDPKKFPGIHIEDLRL